MFLFVSFDHSLVSNFLLEHRWIFCFDHLQQHNTEIYMFILIHSMDLVTTNNKYLLQVGIK